VLVLALDTTTRAGSVAIARDDDLLALVEGDASRTHGERLPAEIARALEIAAIAPAQLNLLVVGSGPGAFTGLRIGLAAMQGLAMVLDKPVVGVSALEALAEAARTDMKAAGATAVAPWMDAQRGEVFAAAYETSNGGALHDVIEPMVGSPEAMFRALPFPVSRDVIFIGDGAVRYAQHIQDAHGPAAHIVGSVPPLAPALARLGRRRAAAGEAGPPHALKPLYVRRPDAELERERQPHI
jgi:tRNA threonylcarbamoyladenosine biosynthesis protein TsaB